MWPTVREASSKEKYVSKERKSQQIQTDHTDSVLVLEDVNHSAAPPTPLQFCRFRIYSAARSSSGELRAVATPCSSSFLAASQRAVPPRAQGV